MRLRVLVLRRAARKEAGAEPGVRRHHRRSSNAGRVGSPRVNNNGREHRNLSRRPIHSRRRHRSVVRRRRPGPDPLELDRTHHGGRDNHRPDGRGRQIMSVSAPTAAERGRRCPGRHETQVRLCTIRGFCERRDRSRARCRIRNGRNGRFPRRR